MAEQVRHHHGSHQATFDFRVPQFGTGISNGEIADGNQTCSACHCCTIDCSNGGFGMVVNEFKKCGKATCIFMHALGFISLFVIHYRRQSHDPATA